MAMKLEEGTVRSIAVPRGKRDIVIYDSQQAGLFLRKFASGKAVYGCKYYVAGQERKVALADARVKGALALARKEAETLRAKARLGTDVVADREAAKAARAAEAKKAVNTLGKVIEKYLTARETELRPRSFIEVKRHLEKHWQPLHKRPIHSITRDDITDALKDVASKSGKVTADRAKTSLSTMFIWALDEKFVTSTPVAFIKRKVGKRKGNRKRTLTPAELREVWLATDAVDDDGGQRLVNEDYARIVKLAILLGQRRTEIGGLDWCEIFEGGASGTRIELPETRTKNHLPHMIPLVPQALALLPARRNSTTKLFGRFGKGYTGWSKSKGELDAAILRARRKVDPNASPMPGWVFHDTRRTLSTQLREQGFADTHLVELILNHVNGTRSGSAGDYDKSERFADRRKALKAWAQHVDGLVKPRTPVKGARP